MDDVVSGSMAMLFVALFFLLLTLLVIVVKSPVDKPYTEQPPCGTLCVVSEDDYGASCRDTIYVIKPDYESGK